MSNVSNTMQRITDNRPARVSVQVVPTINFYIHDAMINVAKESMGDMGFILSIGGDFFCQGRAEEGRAINPREVVPVAAWPDFERRFKAMCPFFEDGAFVIFKEREETDWPSIRLINRQGKMIKEYAKVDWTANQGGQQGGNFGKK